MMSPYLLVGALMQQSADAQRRRRRRMLVGTLLLALGIAGLVASGWVIARATIYAWQTSDRGRLEDAESFAMPFLFFIMDAVFLMLLAPSQVPAAPAFLQEVATDGGFAPPDGGFAPPAVTHMAPFTDEPAARDAERFSSLWPQVSFDEIRTHGAVMLIFVPLTFFGKQPAPTARRAWPSVRLALLRITGRFPRGPRNRLAVAGGHGHRHCEDESVAAALEH